MDNIIIEQLSSGLFRLTPKPGYTLYNFFTGRYHSEVETRNVSQWRAVSDGSPQPQPHERTLEEAKAERLNALAVYDSSEAVNGFTLSGTTMWIAPDERANYIITLQGAQRLGVETVTFLGQTIPVALALQMLDAVNLYAMQCVAVTEAHPRRHQRTHDHRGSRQLRLHRRIPSKTPVLMLAVLILILLIEYGDE